MDGAALERLERQALPLEAGLDHLLDLAPRRAGRDRAEPAQVGDHLEYDLAVALGAEPLVRDRAQPLDPLGPGGLAREAVERRAEQLHDAQQRLGVRHVPQAPLAPVGVALAGGGLALGLAPGAQAHDPAAEAGDDAGLAAYVVPARGPRRDVGAEQRLERDGGEGQELHHGRPLQAPAAEEQQQRSRRPTEAQRKRWVEAMRHADPGQQVREQGRIGLGSRQHDAHLLERDAARGLAQEPSHDRAHLGRLARRCHQLDGGVRGASRFGLGEQRGPARRLEQPLAQADERRGRLGRRHRGERRLRPVGLANAVSGQPAAKRLQPQRRRQRPPQHAHREARGECLDERDLVGLELEVVGDQHLGALEPARTRQALARGGQDRDRVGRAVVDALAVAVVEP